MKTNIIKIVLFLIVVTTSSFTTYKISVGNTTNIRFYFSNWQTQFEDQFNNSSNLSKWEKAERPDFNSNNCIYRANNPKIGIIEDYSCMVLTAKKTGNMFESGHIKSFYTFKPEKNEEYRVEAKIKLVSFKGNEQKNFSQTYGARARFWASEEKVWPTKGEINILDCYSYGKDQNAKYTTNLLYGKNIGVDDLANATEKTYETTDGWHIYTMFWTNVNGKNVLKILLDEVEIATYTNTNHQDLKLENFGSHNIFFNLNIGSNDNTFKNSLVKLNTKTEMYIDWVKVDKRKVTKLTLTNP